MSEKAKNLTLHFTKISIGANALLAVGKLVLAILSFSIFMCINAFYSIGIALAKYFSHQGLDGEKNQKERQDYYRIIGIIILVASLIFAVYSIRMFIGGKSSVYPEIIGISIATFTFAEITLNIRGLLSARRSNNLMLQANKMISLASSLICLVLTQTALMSFAHTGDESVAYAANGLSGIIFGSLAALIGLFMIIHISRVANGKAEQCIKKRACRIIEKQGITALPVNYEDNEDSGRILQVKIDDECLPETYDYLQKIIRKKLNLQLVYIK